MASGYLAGDFVGGLPFACGGFFLDGISAGSITSGIFSTGYSFGSRGLSVGGISAGSMASLFGDSITGDLPASDLELCCDICVSRFLVRRALSSRRFPAAFWVVLDVVVWVGWS